MCPPAASVDPQILSMALARVGDWTGRTRHGLKGDSPTGGSDPHSASVSLAAEGLGVLWLLASQQFPPWQRLNLF